VKRAATFVLAMTLALVGCGDDGAGASASASGSTTGSTSSGSAGGAGSVASSSGSGGGSGGSGGSGGTVGAGGAVTSGWQTLADVPLGPRQEHAVVALDGTIYLLGGFDDNVTLLDSVETYDIATQTWGTAAPLDGARHHPNAAAVDGKLYLVGALVGGGFNALGDVRIYDPGSNQWSNGASMPAGSERGGSAVAVIGTDIYVAGGWRGGPVADFSRYDTVGDSWTPLPDVPTARDHLVGAAIGGVFYLVGGRLGAISSVQDRVDAFDPAVGSWQPRTPMPTPRGGAAAAALGGQLYVFGGEGNAAAPSGVFDDVESYDPAADSWQALAPMPVPRHGFGAASWGTTIYLPGGAEEDLYGASSPTFDSFTP
jgi:N-acetylneuraminic acid mutarotase